MAMLSVRMPPSGVTTAGTVPAPPESRDLGFERVGIQTRGQDLYVDVEHGEGEPAAQRPGGVAALADEELVGHGLIDPQRGATVNRQGVMILITRCD
jgi:hypothetical protein